METTSVISDPTRGLAPCERCAVADRPPARMRGLLGDVLAVGQLPEPRDG